jgi:predicted O-methyltransferase YrrM
MTDLLNRLRNDAFVNLDITDYTPDMQGWKYNAFDTIFSYFVKNLENPTIIEVGTWKGLSACTMADISKNLGIQSKIICIDTWLGSLEHWTQPENLRLVHGYPSLFYTFTKNVKSKGHDDCIFPLPVPSLQGSEILRLNGIQADVIYIDASHDYNSVRSDLNYFWDLLKQKGMMFGDDFSVAWPGVYKAVEQFSLEKNVHLHVTEGVWFLFKV